MTPKPHKATMPLIIEVDDDGPHQLTSRIGANADHECLLIIYPHPTLRQARIQLRMSLQMFAGAACRALAAYLKRINLAHNAVCAFYLDLPEEQPQHNPEEYRSSRNGHA